MSTKLTKEGIPMVESQSLKLVFAAANVTQRISNHLSIALKEKGYEAATASNLNFLSTLECGVNYGSEIARSLGVSRQMVAKSVKELCCVGYLEQVEGTGRQKQIVFSELGEQLMSDSRQILAQLDDMLYEKMGQTSLQETVNRLESVHELVAKIDVTEKEF